VTPIISVVGIIVTVCALYEDLWLTYGPTTCIVFGAVSLVLVFVVKATIARIKPDAATRLAVDAESGA
jgi:hypothetical protein